MSLNSLSTHYSAKKSSPNQPLIRHAACSTLYPWYYFIRAGVSKIQVAGCRLLLFSPCVLEMHLYLQYTCSRGVSPPFQPRRETGAWILSFFLMAFPLWLINAGHGGYYSLGIKGVSVWMSESLIIFELLMGRKIF